MNCVSAWSLLATCSLCESVHSFTQRNIKNIELQSSACKHVQILCLQCVANLEVSAALLPLLLLGARSVVRDISFGRGTQSILRAKRAQPSMSFGLQQFCPMYRKLQAMRIDLININGNLSKAEHWPPAYGYVTHWKCNVTFLIRALSPQVHMHPRFAQVL